MSRGGARFGAGRPGYRVKAEQLKRIDVRDWARRGYLRCPCSFSWSWHRDGEPTGSIGVRVHGPDALTLNYTVTVEEVAHEVAERLPIVSTKLPYGGERPWFSCPCCTRRVAVLYMRGGRFGCRRCKRVAYSSQSEDVMGRMWRVQGKIEAKLGEYWQRPKGMRQRTYRALIHRLTEAEERKEQAFEVMAGRFLGLTW